MDSTEMTGLYLNSWKLKMAYIGLPLPIVFLLYLMLEAET